MSNYPDDFKGTNMDHSATKEDAALEWIETLPKQIELILIAGAVKHDLIVTKTATKVAMGIICEELDDLFANDHHRLVRNGAQTLSAPEIRMPAPSGKVDSVRKMIRDNFEPHELFARHFDENGEVI